MTSIAACLLAKNEEKTIGRCIESLVGLVDEVIIQVDNSTTDLTLEVAWQVCYSLDLRCFSWYAPFVDFSDARNRLLADAREKTRCEYLLMVDCDMTVNFEPHIRDLLLTAWGYTIEHTGPLSYWNTRLIRREDPSWHYVGKTHEVLVHEFSGTIDPPKLPGLTVTHHGDGGARGDKAARDIALLTEQLMETPNDPRSLFYLATTFQDVGNIAEAIRFYDWRSHIKTDWEEERWVAEYRAALLARDVGAMLGAYNSRPSRLEPLYWLAYWANAEELHHLSAQIVAMADGAQIPASDLLFVERWMYDWGMAFEEAVSLWYRGHHDQAEAIWSQLDQRDDIHEPIRSALTTNLAFARAERAPDADS